MNVSLVETPGRGVPPSRYSPRWERPRGRSIYAPVYEVAAPAVVNRAEKYLGTTIASISIPATSHTAGNLLWVFLLTQNFGNAVTITDTAGNTWTQIGSTINDGTSYLYQFYAKNINGNASNVVTATTDGHLNAYHALVVYQLSGADITAPLDGSSTGSGSGTSLATGSITVTTNSLILAGVDGNLGLVAGSGYTLTKVVDGYGGYSGDEYHAVIASEAATATANSGGWLIVGAAFKGSAGSTGGPLIAGGPLTGGGALARGRLVA